MRSPETVMIVGLGELGGILLEYLCRIPGICRIISADINSDWGFRKTNSAILGASYLGLYPQIEFHQIDLLDVEKAADMMKKLNPVIVYNSTTLQSWWVVNELPLEIRNKLYKNRCGLGPWTSMHLALSYKLMKAIKMADIETYVVNASFPDVTNASLAKIDLAPTVGIGNMDLVVPYIQKTASEILQVPMSNVSVEFIAHHFHCYSWCRAGTGWEAPHYLRVFVGKEDVTKELGSREQLISELSKRARRPSGRQGQYLVAASSMKNILAILNDTGELTHAPGPQGLEGGYPVRLSRRGAEVVLPGHMSLQDARSLMTEAQQYDGIQEIRKNGDVVLTEEAYFTFKEILGVDFKMITIKDSYEQAKELRSKFENFMNKFGINIPH